MSSDRSDADRPAASGPVRHIPVLRDEVLAALDLHEGGLYLDATFGAGGYSRAILATPQTRVLALDRDPTAIAGGSDLVAEAQGRLILSHERFSRLALAAQARGLCDFDGVVLDIGLSSMQIDEPQRGFSFRADGPLDMRMEREGPSAADLVNTLDEAALADVLYHFGEERASRRIARAIVNDRASVPFTSTLALAQMIARVAPAKPTEIHPATRSFQALRIAVNDELGELARALVAAESILKPGGKLAVVTFHSLEDRIAKTFFTTRSGRGQAASRRLPGEPEAPEATFSVPKGQPVVASEEEIKRNPRARSAKLRFGIRSMAAPRGLDAALSKLILLPQQDAKGR
jgi:16S rRNA (cytosine1402-N4)-methyltransferase